MIDTLNFGLTTLFTQHLWIWALFSACVGSFLTVVVYRLPLMLEAQERAEPPTISLSLPSSHCPACNTKLTLRDNLPLLGFFLNRGKCRHCGVNMSPRYLGLELLALAWGVFCGYALFGASGAIVCWSLFGWYLLALGWMDAETQWLPDSLTLGLLWIGLLASASGWLGGTGIPPSSAIFGAVAAYMAIEGLNYLFTAVRGVEGIASGDSKLIAALAVWLGGISMVYVVTASFFVTLVAALLLKEKHKIAMGPALALCAFVYAVGRLRYWW